MWESTNFNFKGVVLLAAMLASVAAIATDKEREKSTAPTTRAQTEKPVDAGKRQAGKLPKDREKSAGSIAREKTGVSSSRQRTAE